MPTETKRKKYSSSSTAVERRVTRSQINDSQVKEGNNDGKKNENKDSSKKSKIKSESVKKTNENDCEKKDKNNSEKKKDKNYLEDISEKKEGPPKKKISPAECQNDRSDLYKRRNRSFFIKSSIRNPVVTTINRAQGFATVSRSHKEVVINQIKRFQTFKILSPFDRRTTAMTWHPKYPQVFVAGSKGGDLLLHNLNGGDDYFTPGVGPGGSILGLICCKAEPYTMYTASLTGKIYWENFYQKKSKILLSLPYCWDNWFTSINQSSNGKFLLSGDCKGNAYLLSTSGETIWKEKKVHGSKVTYCEFNIHDPNIFVTSSNDNTVKLWDLRIVSNSEKRAQPLTTFHHLKAVNAAYFSPSNGINILTTDQHSELRIYTAPLWDEVLKITHPHRHFQHMTNIKAIWHPLEDIVIVGRYPDDNVQTNDSRTVDFYDGSNGKLLHRIPSPNNNITSLNAVNCTGEVLACSAGFTIGLLKDEQILNGDRYEAEAGCSKDTENTVLNLKKNKKTRDPAKNAKKICTKTNISLKKKSK